MMFKKFKEYYLLSKQERKILNRTFFWLIRAFVLVRFIPLKWFSSLLGEFRKEIEVESLQIDTILNVKKNIRRAKRILPFRVKCFEEAIAAKKVLEKEGVKSTLYLGVDKNTENELIAHAWLKVGELFVTGESRTQEFKVVGFYS